MSDNIERLAVLIEANTKAYENAMVRLQQQTQKALKSVNDNFSAPAKAAGDFETALAKTGARAEAMSTQAMSLFHASRSAAEGLAMGISPAQILAQQLNHLSYAASGPGGLKGALSEIVGLIGGPTNALVIGGLAAAGAIGYYIYTILDNSSSAEAHLKQQEQLANQIRDAFSGAKTEAAAFYENSRAVLEALTKINIGHLQADLVTAAKSAVPNIPPSLQQAYEATQKALPGLHMAPPPAGMKAAIGGEFDPYRQAIDAFNQSVEAGTPKIKEYRDAVAAVVNATGDEKIKAAGERLLASSEDANKFATKLRQANADLSILNGTATITDKQIAGVAGSTKKASSAFADLVKRTQDQIAEFTLQAQIAGRAGFEVDALKKQHELLRAALKSGLPDTVATRNAVENLATAYEHAREAAAAAKLMADAQFQRAQLGMTPQEAQVQSRLRSAGIDPASAIGEQAAAELRLNQALTETRDLAKSALSTFVSDLQQGKSGVDALRDALTGIESKLLDMAENKLIASLFSGGLGGTGAGGLGGLFSMLFGGFRAGGGDVSAGKAYVVGEKRPELFVPSSSGRIVPSVAGGGSSSVTMPITIDARGADQGAVMRIGQAVQALDQNFARRVAFELHRLNTRGVRS